MALHELAGKSAPRDMLVNIPRLISNYYTNRPNPDDASQAVSFGTSGHRGSSLTNTFNETHIIAISQAICDYRSVKKINGPLFLGMDTHALSEPAMASAIEVFAANRVDVRIQAGFGYTPTPVISHAILTYNQGRSSGIADGVIITPSHNPPQDGGVKYNPPHGGPADAETTKIIQDQANKNIKNGLKDAKRWLFERALKADNVLEYDYITPYIKDLANVIDMDAISNSGITIGADPMGGAGVEFWEPIKKMYGLNLEVVNPHVDQTFSFMRVDKDGKIRMDCSSKYAMAQLIDLKDKYDIAFGNDTDFDRHGIVTKSGGLMNPNHYLSVAIGYLFQHRPQWRQDAAIGKTLVSSSMIDRLASHMGRKLAEVPVGFKWFVDGLIDGSYGFGGEESAGASFLRKDGTTWTTDKDGFIMDLLAAEITAKTDKDPGDHYQELIEQFGDPIYERIDTAATPAQKEVLKNLSSQMVTATELAGDNIIAKLTHAPGNQAAIGGLKVVSKNGWFAARPSGTEDINKIYAESFNGADHLKQIQQEAQEIVRNTFKIAGV